MVAVTLPLLSSNLPDKPDIYWQITKAPYLEKPQPQLNYNLPDYYFTFEITEKSKLQNYYVLINMLDVYTTHRAVNIKGYGIELNPVLGDKPSITTIIATKGIVTFVLHVQGSLDDEKFLHLINGLTTIGVLNNLYVMRKAGDL